MTDLLNIVGTRTKSLDSQMNAFNKSTENKFFEQEEYRAPLSDFVDKLRALVDQNNFIEKTFKEVQAEVNKVGDISVFLGHLEEIEKMVD